MSMMTETGFYEVGDKVKDFELKNVDGKMVSLSDYPDAKGFVVIFTCNHCPYAKSYEDRIIALDKEYKSKGYPIIAINSTNAELEPRDSYENMIIRAEEKGFTYPYLYDDNQDVLMDFGAQSTPTTFILDKNNNNEMIIKYIGAIDDNYSNPAAVKVNYVENALESLLSGGEPSVTNTKAIGCGIKYNESPTTMR